VWVTRFEKPLAILLIVTAIFFMTRVPSAHAASIASITPSSGPPGTFVTVTGIIFNPLDLFCDISSSPSGLMLGSTCAINFGTASASFTVANVPPGLYTVTLTGYLGQTSDSASSSFTVTGGPVGGVVMPANTFALVAPWLLIIGLVGCIGTLVVFARKRRP
jgi:hypothetical protein